MSANEDQRTFWSETAAPKWLRFEPVLDGAFQPVLDAVLAEAALRPGDAVLDIGCGTGLSALQAGSEVGPQGHVLGLDISEPFLNRAWQRAQAAVAGHVAFELADAQTAAIPPDNFDAMISRFGMMFFSDTVAAFRNIASAVKTGGRMVFASWGTVSANPWFGVPHTVASARLGQPPKADRNAPGPFAFHDTARVLAMMAAAGLTDPSVEVLNLRLGADMDQDTLIHTVSTSGPAANIVELFNGTQADIDAIEAAVRARFAESGKPGIPAEINLYHCRA